MYGVWFNTQTGGVESVPQPTEITDPKARKIRRGLPVPAIG
jgi:hypothetical protein